MATKQDAANEAAYMEELVDYMAPLMPGTKKQDIVVAVNGEMIRIQRGVQVQIKRKYLDALQNASKQEYEAMLARQELQKSGLKALAAM